MQRARVVADMQDFMTAQAYMGSKRPHSRAPPGSDKQEAFYEETAILTKTGNGRGQGKEVQEAFDAFHASGGKHVKPEFLSWIEANWKTNPTMIDLDYERSREYDHND
ncbi:unnamed protein product [Zymoseptoria tritici ST99CH_3D7]|uniref:Uncharacterized protein n=3 Tax=Zymoseptoria tritici TaxID=1047171 RepID=A0A1X7RF86_ZYMT9|nr:unnamed protein product [Zymoseptoria tritici ST99CH_3D7]